MFSEKVEHLIQALSLMPSVGKKTAQRLAIHLLQHDRAAATQIANAINAAVGSVGSCQRCRNLSEHPICHICRDSRRNDSLICVVEGPMDVIAIEQSTNFSGRYFVLMGHLSPLDGIGPNELGLDILEATLQSGQTQELILATNVNAEGDATAYYLAELARKYGVSTSRIAFGVPMGGELEYTDSYTLGHAFERRTQF
ncbi:recombination mediator RecR [Ostreibacterium oceani]|uniref:Recombination protein RecR n=1 Tax=Ostreibacterium oceani TaxID=2654998 RepID=A0A6N7EWI4_9GAMM|nr:recombination mediator RecR [Ostreibacterium oceani]MPV85779.1 recombination protein RecR [Ostreibacterium oceani]